MLFNNSHMLSYGEFERQPEVSSSWFLQTENSGQWLLGKLRFGSTVQCTLQNKTCPRRSRGWDAGTEPWCSKQKSICNNNEVVVPTMLGTTVLQNCNYLDVQGQVPQSGAHLSKLSIITIQRTDTQETTLYFFLPNRTLSRYPHLCTQLSFLPLSCCLSTDRKKTV